MSVFRTDIPLWTVVVSIALHAGALTIIDWSRSDLISVMSGPIHLRLVPAVGEFVPHSGSVSEEELPGFRVRAWSHHGQAEKTGAAALVQAPVVDSGTSAVPTGVRANRGAALSAAQNPPMQANPGVSYFNVSDYIPRVYLSVGPEPLTAVEVRPPVDLSGKFAVTIELSLFIDEFGKVQKLRPETPDVAPPFVEAAMRAFEGVAFKPGQLDGKPVRSLIRVAVDFVQD